MDRYRSAILSHRRDTMVILEGIPGCLPVLFSLVFTVDTVYHGGKNINDFPWRNLIAQWFFVVLIGNREARRSTVGLVQAQLVF